MKNFESRVYSVSDLLEWYRNKQLILNTRFQRRSVWNENGRSYLMDTIIRGKPIPKIFMRLILNSSTQKSVREVVDGQQRLRTIFSFLDDGFVINPKHNSEYGGLYFSQLDIGDIDRDARSKILNYEIAVDNLVSMSDVEVLDVFGRLNSYAVILNEQEKINANHFGPFKIMTDKIGHKYNSVWLTNGILSEAQILRMGDASFVADLFIAMIEGIKAKEIKRYYEVYERDFPYDIKDLTGAFDATMSLLFEIMEKSIKGSEYRRVSLFYSLFLSVYHSLYGLKDFPVQPAILKKKDFMNVRDRLLRVDELFEIEDASQLTAEERQFKEDSRRATTNPGTRMRRTSFVAKLLLG